MANSNRTIFEQILEEAKREGYTDTRVKAARDWIRERAREVTEVSETDVMRSKKDNLRSLPQLGSMYMFFYSPKLKDQLPYYDTFPIVIPTEYTQNGFKGINMHYLPRPHRAVLMDKLYPLTGGGPTIGASYPLLEADPEYQFFHPCYKRYLLEYCQSRFLLIEPEEWEIALFLPLERFHKASATRIYNDSLGKIRYRKRRIL